MLRTRGITVAQLAQMCTRTVEVTTSIAHDSYRMSIYTVHRDPKLPSSVNDVVICADYVFGLSRSRFQSPTTVTACQLAQQSIETQRCSGVIEDGLWRGRWVAAQSLRNSIWQGKPACWGLPESNRGCPGPSDIMRETADQNQHS